MSTALLTQNNVDLDRSFLKPGANTLSVDSYEIEGVEPWPDFNYAKVMECFGSILNHNIPKDQIHQPPPILEHFRKPVTEECVEAILLKHNHVIADCALQIASQRT